MKRSSPILHRLRSKWIRLCKKIDAGLHGGDPCYDIYPYYGVGPHVHEGVDLENPITIISSTRMLPKEEWPDNYDDCDDGCGMWYCPDKKCKAICNSRLPPREIENG
jgi:hypothetical protein